MSKVISYIIDGGLFLVVLIVGVYLHDITIHKGRRYNSFYLSDRLQERKERKELKKFRKEIREKNKHLNERKV